MQGTPSSKRQAEEAFHRIIRSLNGDYPLAIGFPDPTLSPSRRKSQRLSEEQAQAYEIYSRARYLHFQQPEKLSICIGSFRQQADALLRDWVAKPKGDPDTVPRITAPAPLGVGSEKERAALRLLLLSLLKVAQAPRTSSKRHTDEFPNSEAKRSKAQMEEDDGSATDGIDDIPVRTSETASATRFKNAFPDGAERLAPPSFVQSRPASFIDRSANSSKASLATSVFSASGEEYPPNSQTTIDANESYQATQESYSVCTQECQVPDESFSLYDQGRNNGKIQQEELFLPEPQKDSPPASQGQNVTQHGPPQNFGSEGTAYPSSLKTNGVDARQTSALADRLKNIWPKFPTPGLNHAPLLILWEITRAALHCGVDLSQLRMDYQPGSAWHDQTKFRHQIVTHQSFVGKGLPHSCDTKAWEVGLGSFQPQGKDVTLCVELSYRSGGDDGPLYNVKLQPPKLELAHRLSRRFGADRFLEVIIPSPTANEVPNVIKHDEQGPKRVIRWLTDSPHYFLGRTWIPFFTSDATKVVKDPQVPDKTARIKQERIFFFAVDGINFRRPDRQGRIPDVEEALKPLMRTKMRRCDLLTWALGVEANADQSVPKLFSRLKLSLSRTWPTVVLAPEQIRHRSADVGQIHIDGNGKETSIVMNDGIGRLSRNLARRIAASLHLDDVPTCFQGRLGSAKGMWIIDVEQQQPCDEDWIETFPSQRKWKCDFRDIHHRTLEVRSWSKELRTASLNRQFIPILEAQSVDPIRMRQCIAKHLANGLRADLDAQKNALDHPIDFRLWMQRAGFSSADRQSRTHVPFLAGLPDKDEDTIPFLLDAGFEPKKNKYLNKLVWEMRTKQADQLKAKMNIKVPQSAYAYMVVDFTGTLKEGEVQLAFSTKFQTEGHSETLLDGIDVLVARAPAHFASDVQKVRAVFNPKLKDLKDVVVFSSKGDSPLADKLSGGDYDGDQAWVCWDPLIVENFTNASVPDPRDLSAYLGKFKTTFKELMEASMDLDTACARFIHSALEFSMQDSLLGICTSFKEKLCYHQNDVKSESAIVLSTLAGLLVDQSKQGTLFSRSDFERLCEAYKMPKGLPSPAYEGRSGAKTVKQDQIHVLDYLRLWVAEQTVHSVLEEFYTAIDYKNVLKWDGDLARLYNEYSEMKGTSGTIQKLMTKLSADLREIEAEWSLKMCPAMLGKQPENYSMTTLELHQRYLDIKPPEELKSSASASSLLDEWNGDPNLSKWALLKASTMFKLCYNRNYNAVWRLAGRQLAWMKAMLSYKSGNVGAVAVTEEMWNVLRPDKKHITNLAAQRGDGQDSESLAAIEEVTEYDEYGTQIDDS